VLKFPSVNAAEGEHGKKHGVNKLLGNYKKRGKFDILLGEKWAREEKGKLGKKSK